MRTTIEIAGYKPEDVRPKALIEEYERLLAVDVAAMPRAQTLGCCPGCGSEKKRPAFERLGLEYSECQGCGTVWVAQRPDEAVLRAHYRDSASERFWQTRLARETDATRVVRIIEPRVAWIVDSTQEYRPHAQSLADIETHLEAFANRLPSLGKFGRRVAIDPVAATPAGLEVIDEPVTALAGKASFDVITLFEVLDKSADPNATLKAAFSMLKPGGLCFVTAILASGFDIQTLWEKARIVLPPDRLTLFSATGLRGMIERAGLEVVEFSTPGAFDLATVANAAAADPSLMLPRFVSTLLKHRGGAEREQFQTFLQMSLLSSFGRVLARRPG